LKDDSLHFIQAAPRVAWSTIYGNFANQVAWFSCIFLHLISKGHVKRWSVRGHDRFPVATRVRLFLPFIFEQLKLI